MKYFIIATLFTLFVSSFAFGAKGDKPVQIIAKFGNVSTSAVPCTAGEIRFNSTHLFLCNSTNSFKRYSAGSF